MKELYKAVNDISVHTHNSAFTLPEGCIVMVIQKDERSNKVLVQIDPCTLIWKDVKFLEHFKKLIRR